MNNEIVMMEMLQKLVVSVDDMQQNMNRRFDQVEARLENVETRLTNVEERLENVETRLADVEVRLENVETGLADVEIRLGKVETDLVDVKVRLDNVEMNLQTLNTRVGALEKTNGGLGEMFEYTVQLQQEATSKIHEVLQFHAHKITENEKSIFFLKHRLSS